MHSSSADATPCTDATVLHGAPLGVEHKGKDIYIQDLVPSSVVLRQKQAVLSFRVLIFSSE